MQFTYIGSQSKKDVRLVGSFANGAFVTANSAASFANGAFGAANSAGTYANSAFTKANNTLSLTGGIIAGNVTANSFIANTSVYSPVYYSPSGTTNLTLSDIGIVAINSGGQEIKFGGAGIESSKGIYGGSYGGNKLSLDNETKLISNRYDTVKIATGTDGTTVNEWTFSNNQLIFPDNTYQNTAFQGVAIDQTSRNTANSASLYANGAFGAANSASDYANGAFTTANLKFNTSGGTISGDVNITGNLSVTGNTFSTSATQIVANDTLFIMGTGNYSGDVLDVGFAAHYNNGINAHTGLIRDAGTKEWQLFEEYTPEVGANNNIIITDGSFKIATLNANLKSTTITIKNIDLLPYVNNAYDKANSGASFANGAFTAANSGASFANAAFSQANSNYTSAVTKLNVTNSGASAYLIDQYSGNNPSIYVSAGETIAFNLDVSGHPFLIRESSGGANTSDGLTHISTSGTITTGFNAQEQESGILFWKVPFSLVGSTYVYQCLYHGGMVGNIVIQQPASFVASNTALAFSQANNAYTQANTATTNAATADSKAVVSGSFANAAFTQANASFDKANTSANFANGAFIVANSSYDKANSGASFANGAFDRANAAYNAANTSSTDSYARNNSNAAYSTANSGSSFANAAFDRANAAYNAANTGGGSGTGTPVSIYSDRFTANGATTTFTLSVTPTSENYIIAVVDGITQLRDTYSVSGSVVTFDSTFENGANVEVTTITGGGSIDPYAANTANLAYAQANAAYNAANSGSSSAFAFNQANAAFDAANSASSFANGAFVTANASYNSQNTTASFANGAFTAANTADDKATSAGSFANGAFVAANSSASFANGAFDRANAAYNAANTATDTWVRTQANNAYDTANSAGSFANGAFITANAVFSQSNNQVWPQANAAFAAANLAYAQANAAFAQANTGGGGGTTDTYARDTANAAFITANAAFTQANTGSGTSLSKTIAMAIVFGF